MGKSDSKKVSVGIFVVVGTILYVAALYFVGKQQHLFSKNIKLYSVFADVSGLQLSNNVRYSGVNVGTVSKSEMTAEGKITVEMSIAEDASKFMKKDALATIASDGLVGSMVVNIVPGENNAAKVVASGDWIAVKTKVSVDEILETFSRTNASAELITSDLAKITHKVVEGKGALGAILSDSLLEKDLRRSVEAMKQTAQGATRAMAQVNAIIAKVNYDESAASVLLSDKKTQIQIQNVFTNLEKSSTDISKISKNIEQYVDELKTGKGAINYIAKDETLVKNLDSTVVSTKQAADKMNQNMEALKHNFLFRGYFRKLEKKERKEKEKQMEENKVKQKVFLK